MKVKFSVTRVPIAGQQVFEREGLRLLIGRYVIYQKRIALLKAINRGKYCGPSKLSDRLH
jgi:hypothetical protein